MISFIYFDVGGVLAKDFSNSNKWDLLREELGIQAPYQKKFVDFWKLREKEICTGVDLNITQAQIENEFNITFPQGYSLLNAFVKRFEKNPSIWALIEEVRKSYKIGLLTNMYTGMFSAIQKAHTLPDVTWDVIIDSSIVGYAKPDTQIFNIAQEKSGVRADEIFYIDNSKAPLEAAKKLGWMTFLYDSSNYEQASRILQDFIRSDLR